MLFRSGSTAKDSAGRPQSDGSAPDKCPERPGEIAGLVVAGGHDKKRKVRSSKRGDRPGPCWATEHETLARMAGAKRVTGS